jgi:hypothetical protein
MLFIPHLKVNLLMIEILQAAPSVRGLGFFKVNQKLFPTVGGYILKPFILNNQSYFFYDYTASWNCIDVCYNFMPIPCFGAANGLNNWSILPISVSISLVR